MKFTLEEVALATGGTANDASVFVSGVRTDSRSIESGELFVPLHGVRDGHEFVPLALAAGAAAYLTDRDPEAGAAVQVADTAAALRDLTRFGRNRLQVFAVAVTGSVGKTTTKDLVSSVLGTRFRTHASPYSYNNDVGLPVTVLNADDDIEALVVELGANRPGEIERLCRIAQPDIGVVTCVAPVHTEGFGSIDGVARAKSELVRALPPTGLAVLNVDDPRVEAMAKLTEASVLTFGRSGDVRVEVLELADDLRPRVRACTPWGEFEVVLAARGAHQAANAAAAIAVGGAKGIGLDEIAGGLAQASLSANRMDLRRGLGGAVVLDDSYNASPLATEAALRAAAAVPGARRFAVLGVMAELGALEAAEHQRIGDLARRLGFMVISVAAPGYRGEDVSDGAAALERLSDLREGDVVLVKGSRVAGLDKVAAALRGESEGWKAK